MATPCLKSTPEPTPFAEADALFGVMKEDLSGDALLHAAHDEVERYAVAKGREVVRALIETHMELRGQGVAIAPVVDADGEERTHVRSDRERGLTTTVGKVRVPRVEYGGRGLAALHPTDAALNLPIRSYSFELCRKVAMTAVEQAFEATGKLVAEYTGVTVGLRQIEEIAREAAADMELFYASGSRVIDTATSSDILVLSVDQKGVVVRREDLREETKRRAEQSAPKLDSRLAPGEKRDRKRMATVTAVYTIAPYVRTAEEVVAGLRRLRPADGQDPPKRPRPEQKRVSASVTAELKAEVRAAFDEADRRDPLHVKQWFAVVDGDPKLQRCIAAEAKRRDVKITLVLDFIHALEYLWRAGCALFEKGSRELEDWVLDRLTAILKGRVSDVAAGMRRSATKRGLSRKKRKPIDTAARYFLKRKTMMRYGELLAIGAPIASGVIEGTCRSLINDRLDVTGARWSLAGAEAILRLRAIVRSGDWDAYWAFHTQAEYQRNHVSRYANGEVPEVRIPKKRGHLTVVK